MCVNVVNDSSSPHPLIQIKSFTPWPSCVHSFSLFNYSHQDEMLMKPLVIVLFLFRSFWFTNIVLFDVWGITRPSPDIVKKKKKIV